MSKKFDINDLIDFIDETIARHPTCKAVLKTVRYRVEKLRDER